MEIGLVSCTCILLLTVHPVAKIATASVLLFVAVCSGGNSAYIELGLVSSMVFCRCIVLVAAAVSVAVPLGTICFEVNRLGRDGDDAMLCGSLAITSASAFSAVAVGNGGNLLYVEWNRLASCNGLASFACSTVRSAAGAALS